MSSCRRASTAFCSFRNFSTSSGAGGDGEFLGSCAIRFRYSTRTGKGLGACPRECDNVSSGNSAGGLGVLRAEVGCHLLDEVDHVHGLVAGGLAVEVLQAHGLHGDQDKGERD